MFLCHYWYQISNQSINHNLVFWVGQKAPLPSNWRKPQNAIGNRVKTKETQI